MTGRIPTIFISSTFRGLEAIRSNLARFIEHELGYRALLFEESTFPVEPDADTVENCRRRVQNDADVFVLIIVDRYGYIPPASQLSVTNIEYLAARAKGIPIYAFIAHGIITEIERRERNPNDIVVDQDTSMLLDFVKQIRSTDAVWTFSFKDPHDIIATLRTQLAYQMTRGLILQARIHTIDTTLNDLSGNALRLVLEKPIGWSGLLFAQILIDEVNLLRDLIGSYYTGVAFGSGEAVSDDEIHDWMHARFADASRNIEHMSKLMNQAVNVSLSSGDVGSIISYARLVSTALRETLEWAQLIRRTHVHDDWEPVKNTISMMCDNVISKLEGLGDHIYQEIQVALNNNNGQAVRKVMIELSIDMAYADEYNQALEVLKRKRGWL